MPEEIYSKRGTVPDNGTLAKVIFNDVVRQPWFSTGVASGDTANCYGSVAHAITSLPCQTFGVPVEAVHSMLTTIEDTKYYIQYNLGN